MVEKILQCPYCGSDNTKVSDFYGSWCGTCLDCEATINDAVLSWNAAANALEQKDAEIARLTAALADTEEQRHETVSKLSLSLIREANGDKRQDELEAEIARLTAACDDLEGEYLRMKEHSENLMLRINQLEEYKETWYKRAKESLEQRDEARKVARRYYQESERKDGDITRLREEIDKVNALRPIGEPPIIAYYTPHGQPVSVTNNPVSYTRTEPQTIRVAETSESDGN